MAGTLQRMPPSAFTGEPFCSSSSVICAYVSPLSRLACSPVSACGCQAVSPASLRTIFTTVDSGPMTLVLSALVSFLCCRDRLFVFGGMHPSAVDQQISVSTDMHSFDLVTLQWQNWTQIGSVPKAR